MTNVINLMKENLERGKLNTLVTNADFTQITVAINDMFEDKVKCVHVVEDPNEDILCWGEDKANTKILTINEVLTKDNTLTTLNKSMNKVEGVELIIIDRTRLEKYVEHDLGIFAEINLFMQVNPEIIILYVIGVEDNDINLQYKASTMNIYQIIELSRCGMIMDMRGDEVEVVVNKQSKKGCGESATFKLGGKPRSSRGPITTSVKDTVINPVKHVFPVNTPNTTI